MLGCFSLHNPVNKEDWPRMDTKRMPPTLAESHSCIPGFLHTTQINLFPKMSYPTPEVRGSHQEEQPHVQGAVAACMQEGREELFQVQGQEGQR